MLTFGHQVMPAGVQKEERKGRSTSTTTQDVAESDGTLQRYRPGYSVRLYVDVLDGSKWLAVGLWRGCRLDWVGLAGCVM